MFCRVIPEMSDLSFAMLVSGEKNYCRQVVMPKVVFYWYYVPFEPSASS